MELGCFPQTRGGLEGCSLTPACPLLCFFRFLYFPWRSESLVSLSGRTCRGMSACWGFDQMLPHFCGSCVVVLFAFRPIRAKRPPFVCAISKSNLFSWSVCTGGVLARRAGTPAYINYSTAYENVNNTRPPRWRGRLRVSAAWGGAPRRLTRTDGWMWTSLSRSFPSSPGWCMCQRGLCHFACLTRLPPLALMDQPLRSAPRRPGASVNGAARTAFPPKTAVAFKGRALENNRQRSPMLLSSLTNGSSLQAGTLCLPPAVRPTNCLLSTFSVELPALLGSLSYEEPPKQQPLGSPPKSWGRLWTELLRWSQLQMFQSSLFKSENISLYYQIQVL